MDLTKFPKVFPKSFVARLDLVTALGAGPDTSTLARLCAAATLLRVDVPESPKRKKGEAIADFGERSLEWLMGKGVAPTTIFQIGSECASELGESLPSVPEVDDAVADFQEAVSTD